MRQLQITLPVLFIAGLVSACGTSSVTNIADDTPTLSLSSDGASTPGVGAIGGGGVGESTMTQALTTSVKKSVAAITSVATPGSKAYKIGPLDVVEITVFKVPELSKVVQLSEVGTLNYPLIGELNVAGMTARQVEQKLTAALGEKYLRNPQVSVFVKEYNSQRITIEGTVKKPGVYPLKGGLTLLQAVALAEGMDATVSDNTLVVFRTTQGKKSVAKFDIGELRSGAIGDPPLRAGDVIVANPSQVKQGFDFILKSLRLTSVFAFI